MSSCRATNANADDVYVECSWHHASTLRGPFYAVGSPRLDVVDSEGGAFWVDP